MTLAHTEHFLTLLFEDLAPHWVEIRLIEDRKGAHPPERAWYPDLYRLVCALPDVLRHAEAKGRAVYFGVLPRLAEGGGTVSEVAPGWVAWVDLDFKDVGEGDARSRIAALEHAPSIVVHSGRGLHLYWLMKEPTEAGALSSLSRRLSGVLGGDHCFDAARILRLPGSRNLKHCWGADGYRPSPDGPVCVVERCDASLRYIPADFDDLPEATEPKTITARALPRKTDIGTSLPLAVRELLDRRPRLAALFRGEGKPEGSDRTTSGYDFSFAIALAWAGIDDPDALDAAVASRPSAKPRTPRAVRRCTDRALAFVAARTAPPSGGSSTGERGPEQPVDDPRRFDEAASAVAEPPVRNSAEPPRDALEVLADAFARVTATLDAAARGRVAMEIRDPALVHALARHDDAAGVLAALRRLRVPGFTADARLVERLLEKERARLADEQLAEQRQAEAGARRAAAVARARAEEWPPDRRGTHPAVAIELDVARDGRPRPGPANVFKVLRNDPRFGPRVRLNRLGDVVEIGGAEAPAEGLYTMKVVEWLADNYQIQTTQEVVRAAVWAVAEENAYHPVREYLEGLPAWDGRSRLPELLTKALRCDDDPIKQRFIRCFLIAAVARIFEPGCKVRSALVLIGDQYIGKSTFFEALFSPPWFGDSPLPIGNKDAEMLIRSVWAYEAAELNSFERATVEAVKQFMTTSTDRYRAPYDRAPRAHRRQSVMCGTTNKRQFLNDPTGSTRFWPIEVPGGNQIDHAWVREHRDALWGEALTAYVRHEPWHLNPDEESARQDEAGEFVVTDLWEDAVLAYVQGEAKKFTTEAVRPIPTGEILVRAVSVPVDRQGSKENARVRDILTRGGWAYSGRRNPDTGITVRGWLRRSDMSRAGGGGGRRLGTRPDSETVHAHLVVDERGVVY